MSRNSKTQKEAVHEYGVARFKVGDLVSCQRWDKTVRPQDALGIQRVVAVKVGQFCESGVMVKLSGRERELAQNWLKPADAGMLLFEI